MEQLYPVYRPKLNPYEIYDDLRLPKGYDDRPYVAVNMVTSIDGKITLDQSHQQVKLGSSVDRELMTRLRVHFDGVLRGAETVRANPSALRTSDRFIDKRREEGKVKPVVAIVASRSLRLPVDAAYFQEQSSVIVLTTERSDPDKRKALRRRADVEVVGDEDLDVKEALSRLKRKYGIARLLVEGGATLNDAFIRHKALDSLFWTLAPKVSGFSKDLTMVEGPSLMRPTPRFTLHTLFHHDDELFFHWLARR